MTESARANHLRERAAGLRRLAVEIEALPVLNLDRHADDDTWRGRRPALCRATLATNQHQLHAAADDLRSQAYRLEQYATDLDILVRRTIGLAG